MERQLRLNEDMLRFMTIHVEAIEEAQSAILSRKSDERERGFRGPQAGRTVRKRPPPRLRRARGIPRPRRIAVPDFRAGLEE